MVLAIFSLLPITTNGMNITYNDSGNYNTLGEFLQNLHGAKEFYIGSDITIKNNIEPNKSDRAIVRAIEMLEQNNGDLVSVLIDGEVSDVTTRSEDNRLILEIKNSTRLLAQTIMPFKNDTIELIESSDNDGVTTIAFTLKREAHVETIISDNRDEIIVQFYGKPIDAIVAGTDSAGDYLVLNGIKSTEVNLNIYDEAEKLRIKVPHNYLDTKQRWANFKGDYINTIKVDNAMGGLEIEVDLKKTNFNYQFEETEGALFIRFQKVQEEIGEAFFGEIPLEAPTVEAPNATVNENTIAGDNTSTADNSSTADNTSSPLITT